MIHKQPSTLPLYCGIDDLPSVASMIQANYLLQGVILQLDNATPHNTYEHKSLHSFHWEILDHTT